MRRSTLLCALAGLMASTPALAIDLGTRDDGRPITLEFTESLFVDFHTELDDPALEPNPDRVFDLRNRLNVRFLSGPWSIGARLDTAIFPKPPSDQYRTQTRLEELYLKLRLGRWTLTVGDDYVSLGRGMALSLRKVDEVGFDVTLRGAHVAFRKGPVALRLDAGVTNVVNVDNVQEKLVPDPHDLLVAARVEVSPHRKVKLGVHGVDIERRHSDLVGTLVQPFDPITRDDVDPQSLSGERYQRSWIVGGSVEATALGDKVSLYFEADRLETRTSRDTLAGLVGKTRVGHAIYGSATLYTGPWTLLAEVKDYDNFSVDSTPHPDTFQESGITATFPYVAPPTLERLDQRIAQNSDVSGAHIRLAYRLPKSAAGDRQNLFFSVAGFLDAPEVDHFTTHTYAGWEFNHHTGHRAQVQVGYRSETSPGGSDVGLRMVHLDFDAFVLLAGRHDLQFHWSHEFRNENPDAVGINDRYVEGSAYLTWDFTPHWALTAQLDYLNDDDNDSAPVFPGMWVMYRFNQGSFVRVFGGRSKGGLKCSGGICRVFPDFEGVKLEAAVRF